MTITRERQSNYTGRKTHRRHDPRAGERSHPGIWYLHQKYAGCGKIKIGQGSFAPAIFAFV